MDLEREIKKMLQNIMNRDHGENDNSIRKIDVAPHGNYSFEMVIDEINSIQQQENQCRNFDCQHA